MIRIEPRVGARAAEVTFIIVPNGLVGPVAVLATSTSGTSRRCLSPAAPTAPR